MYYNESNMIGLQNYYENNKNMFFKLNEEQKNVVNDYINFEVKDKINSIANLMHGYDLKGISYSPENDTLSFGLEDRTGKFLSLNTAELKNLLGATGEIIRCYAVASVNELKYCVYILTADLTNEYINGEYPMIPYAIKELGIMNNYDLFINKFITCGMVLPKFLKDYFNNNLRNEFAFHIFERSICEVLKKNELTQDEKQIYYTNNAEYIKEARQKIMVTYNEAERLMLAVRLVNFADVYEMTSRHETINIMNLVKASMHEVYYVHAKNGDRIATKREKRQLIDGIYKKELYFMPLDKRELLLYYAWAITNNYHLINKLVVWDKNITVIDDVAWIKINEALNYLKSSQFLKIDVYELQKGIKETVYPNKADDEIRDPKLDNKLKEVYNKYKNVKNDSYAKMITDIANKAIKYGDVLSEKQIAVINRAYDSMLNDNKSYNKYGTEIEEKINALFNFFAYKKTDFQYNFLHTILQYKKCSVKQKDLIDQWYDEMQEQKKSMLHVDEIDLSDEEENTEVPNRVQEYSKDSSDMFIDDMPNENEKEQRSIEQNVVAPVIDPSKLMWGGN